ncbi:MAG: pyridoxamine 5'-phosphate oxidase family protein [Anaerolineae bacterium]|nr:pyridoxamine 5'-phosphate oxidase family protein [Anaerolineae bacterium]
MPEYGLLDAAGGSGLFPWSHVSERMAKARNYWVATTQPDGRPHVAPVWGLWLDEAFYFSTGKRSRKARNLDLNSGIVVHLESGDDVVILEGVAEKVTDATLLARLDKAYFTKYKVQMVGGDNPIYTLRPRVAYAWLERDFPGSATRWQFGEPNG